MLLLRVFHHPAIPTRLQGGPRHLKLQRLATPACLQLSASVE